MSETDRTPRIDRTPYVPADLPDRVRLWFCPACGHRIVGSYNGSYNLEPARKRCTKTWHLANPVSRDYVAVADEEAAA
jgi:hypothetical protein